MQSYEMIIGIVPRHSGELLTHAAVDAGAGGGTIVMGRGTASNSILQMLGFGDAAKDIVFVLTPSAQIQKITNAMINAVPKKNQPFGIMFSIDISNFIKNGEENISEDSFMDKQTSHQLISIIVNHGYADDVMAAARKAGAGGGTIINARGTAKNGDPKFFGMEIVPEKDMVLILSAAGKENSIIEAIKNLPFLEKPGSGIAYCSPAKNFTILGKQ